jgi:hypothetical protein
MGHKPPPPNPAGVDCPYLLSIGASTPQGYTARVQYPSIEFDVSLQLHQNLDYPCLFEGEYTDDDKFVAVTLELGAYVIGTWAGIKYSDPSGTVQGISQKTYADQPWHFHGIEGIMDITAQNPPPISTLMFNYAIAPLEGNLYEDEQIEGSTRMAGIRNPNDKTNILVKYNETEVRPDD